MAADSREILMSFGKKPITTVWSRFYKASVTKKARQNWIRSAWWPILQHC